MPVHLLVDTDEDMHLIGRAAAQAGGLDRLFGGVAVQVLRVRPGVVRLHGAGYGGQGGRDWAVVMLTASECPEHPGQRCVMEVLTRPGMTSREAREVAGGVPKWTRPHIVPVTDPGMWEGETMDLPGTTPDPGGGPFRPDWVVAPAASLAELMRDNSVTVGLVARAAVGASAPAGQQQVAARLVRDVLERRPLTPVHAGTLAAATGTSRGFWLNYEQNYRAGLAAGLTDTTGDLSYPGSEGGP